MLQTILKDRKLSIIERNAVKQIYTILNSQKDRITTVINDSFLINNEKIKKYIATILTLILQYESVYKEETPKTIEDVLQLDYSIIDRELDDIAEMLEVAVYDFIMELEIGSLLYYSGEYKKVIYDMGDDFLGVLTDIFEYEFIMPTKYSLLFDINDYIKEIGWGNLTVEEIMDIGGEYAKQLELYYGLPWCDFYLAFQKVV